MQTDVPLLAAKARALAEFALEQRRYAQRRAHLLRCGRFLALVLLLEVLRLAAGRHALRHVLARLPPGALPGEVEAAPASAAAAAAAAQLPAGGLLVPASLEPPRVAGFAAAEAQAASQPLGEKTGRSAAAGTAQGAVSGQQPLEEPGLDTGRLQVRGRGRDGRHSISWSAALRRALAGAKSFCTRRPATDNLGPAASPTQPLP